MWLYKRLSPPAEKKETTMTIEWTQDLSVGVDIIDEQHKELFHKINVLLEACQAGKGKQAIAEVIQFLEDYVIAHFQMEEQCMLANEYPYYSAHKELHAKFMEDFCDLKEKFRSQGANLALLSLTNRVVVEWLVNHIGKVDKALGEFLRPLEASGTLLSSHGTHG